MNKLTRSVTALLVVGSATAFGATKELVATSDVSMRNDIAIGYSDDACFESDSKKLNVTHFCC